MTARVAEKCVLYCGDSEVGYVMCCRRPRALKVYKYVCETTCPYYKEKGK